MSTEDLEGKAFELSGGALCLDFVNTLGDRPRRSQEGLRSYGDLLLWALEAKVVTVADGRRLLRQARRAPREAEAVLARAVVLRECLYDTIAPIAAGSEPPPDAVARLRVHVTQLLSRLRLAPRARGLEWRLLPEPGALDAMLPPVVRSALELLTGSESERVRECGSPVCSWLFVDRSRTHRRRWCDMKVCGNRAKARRYYARRRGAVRPAGTLRGAS